MSATTPAFVNKTPTGIEGFDTITLGGIPKGVASLVAGMPGTGKSMFGLHVLINGALKYQEGGVYISFQESPQRLNATARSIGVDLDELIEQNLLSLDHISFGSAQVTEAQNYTLDGLFLRIEEQLEKVNGKRLVIDSLDNLFEMLSDTVTVSHELRRLLAWLEEKQVTTILVGESHEAGQYQDLFQHFACECVIQLDNRIVNESSTRRLRISKYRGSKHGSNEYPFLISENGLTVVPLSSINLNYEATDERVSTGIDRLDDMLGGTGIHRGSVLLISGTAGAGKTTLANYLAKAACERGERCLYFAMEEAENQIVRNLKSTGLHVEPHIQSGLLKFSSMRPVNFSLEEHLIYSYKYINEFKPDFVVIDPMTHLAKAGTISQASSFLMRMTSYLKTRNITTIFTDLIHQGSLTEQTSTDFSSFIDVWMLMKTHEVLGERCNTLQVLKARGTDHSRQVREFKFTNSGIDILDAYAGSGGLVTGVQRAIQEEKDRQRYEVGLREMDRLRKDVERRRVLHDAKRTAMQVELEGELSELERQLETVTLDLAQTITERERMSHMRGGEGLDPASEDEGATTHE